jgi:hypothetical protein
MPNGNQKTLFGGLIRPFTQLAGSQTPPITPRRQATPTIPTPLRRPVDTGMTRVPFAPSFAPPPTTPTPIMPKIEPERPVTPTPTTPTARVPEATTQTANMQAQLEAMRKQALGIQSQFGQLPTAPTVSPTPEAPVAPTAPAVSPEVARAVSDAEKNVAKFTEIGAGELSTQEDIDKLIESAKKGIFQAGQQAIPLEFVTGQQRAIEQRALGLVEPLQRKLARLQAQRTGALEASRFALERADIREEREIETAREARETAEALRVEEESRRRFEEQMAATQRQIGLTEQKFEEQKRQFGEEFALKEKMNRAQISKILADIEEDAPDQQISEFRKEREGRILQSVDELIGKISFNTVGFVGATARKIAGTPARDFKADLDTLKANISFSELQAMREASKTGGALGQVAVRELELLEATLGALDQGQSQESFRKNLQKIRDSISTFNKALDEGAPTTNLRQRVEDAGFDYDAMRNQGFTDEQIESEINKL